MAFRFGQPYNPFGNPWGSPTYSWPTGSGPVPNPGAIPGVSTPTSSFDWRQWLVGAGTALVDPGSQQCPTGMVNRRSRALTAVLGPDCVVGESTEPVVPRPLDPLGLGPQRPVEGDFGAIGSAPMAEARAVRVCPRGPDGRKMVLAIDGRCYPKAMVPARFRAVPPRPKPPVTRADFKAITRADRARKKLVGLTKRSGAHASMTRPRSTPRKKC